MAHLRFSFGTMGSGKSTLALQVHYNLLASGSNGLLITCLDRNGHCVSSRLGASVPAIHVDGDLDLVELFCRTASVRFIVCDEAQFLTLTQCEQLARIVDDFNVDVFAFGLSTDFQGRLFPRSGAAITS